MDRRNKNLQIIGKTWIVQILSYERGDGYGEMGTFWTKKGQEETIYRRSKSVHLFIYYLMGNESSCI